MAAVEGASCFGKTGAAFADVAAAAVGEVVACLGLVVVADVVVAGRRLLKAGFGSGNVAENYTTICFNFLQCLALDATANCICEIRCIALDGFDLNTVHKLSS